MLNNRNRKSIFSKNMEKARRRKGWTQRQAAEKIGLKRPTLGAYEEGRSEPPHEVQVKICHTYHIKDWIAFLTNPDYFKENSTVHR
jgi:DNA-binding XRE family transcriptional regulator